MSTKLPCTPSALSPVIVVGPILAPFWISIGSLCTPQAAVSPGWCTQMVRVEGTVSLMALKWVLADTGMETAVAGSCFWWAVRKDGCEKGRPAKMFNLFNSEVCPYYCFSDLHLFLYVFSLFRWEDLVYLDEKINTTLSLWTGGNILGNIIHPQGPQRQKMTS